MRRHIGVVAVFAILQAIACAAATHQTDTTPSATTRTAILVRSIAWANDTIPVVRFNPPWAYGAWRLEIEACSGLHREGWPAFYVAPIAPLPGPDAGHPRAAYYDERSRSIVFALGTEGNASIAKHEILHYLLFPFLPRVNADTMTVDEAERWAHPTEYYGATGRCAQAINSQRASNGGAQ